MKRVNYARVKYQLERGYDPINLSTNLKAPTAFGTAPPTMWSRFHRDESSEGFTGIGTNTLSDTRRTPAAYSSGMGRLLSGRSSPTTGANMTSSINSNVDRKPCKVEEAFEVATAAKVFKKASDLGSAWHHPWSAQGLAATW